MKTTKGWYYDASFGYFGGIYYWDDAKKPPDVGVDSNSWGPFPTFTAAKHDAISYFKTDIIESRRAINEIRATRKPR